MFNVKSYLSINAKFTRLQVERYLNMIAPSTQARTELMDYEEDKKRRLGIDSTIPHRLKYKKFSR